MEVTLGGERLGSGKRNKIWMRDYERSNHDLSYVWRSTMASGTLVPFMKLVALPGDTFDIDLNVDVLTHPTIGPLFGSYKIQLDVFQVPVRLYQGELHMNMLGIGMDMSKVQLPELSFTGAELDYSKPIDNQHTNPSSLLAYLGIRGAGHKTTAGEVTRKFNAIPYLGYWDIYKNYYANKQEEIGAMIHKNTNLQTVVLTAVQFKDTDPEITINLTPPAVTYQYTRFKEESYCFITGTGITENFDPKALIFSVEDYNSSKVLYTGEELFGKWEVIGDTVIGTIPATWLLPTGQNAWGFALVEYDNTASENNFSTRPEIVTFPLDNIDNMRKTLLQYTGSAAAYTITSGNEAPYGLPLSSGQGIRSTTFPQEGLALKTYQSDLFNNWIQTEWIDGVDGISAVTAVDTSGGSFTIDELNLSKKIYDMLNRIALSGGSYDDWLDAVYTHERTRSAENPIYLGGAIRNLVFQEVISNSRSLDQPLGTLAGRGVVGSKDKGGHVVAKVDEPSYLLGIISITPYTDYSQGNDWDTYSIKTMNDFHKPALDQIGFQDLVTDQMAWWDTEVAADYTPTYKSAGKQPAWINYMTAVNKVYGNFADETQQMFMVLNRRYNLDLPTATTPTIKDLTTYIDPTKFNHIFADTRLDAQNFWAQIGVNIEARRKMSAKVIPNL